MIVVEIKTNKGKELIVKAKGFKWTNERCKRLQDIVKDTGIETQEKLDSIVILFKQIHNPNILSSLSLLHKILKETKNETNTKRTAKE